MSREKKSYKRRDDKGRILRNGESQHSDGRYRYTYVKDGKPKCVYSWKLEDTDDVPLGKREDISLREKEILLVRRNYEEEKKSSNISVLQLVKKYLSMKTGVRPTTRMNYKTVTNILEKEEFSGRMIGDVKISDAKEFLIKLQQFDKRSYSSIHTIRGVLKPAFQMAVDDDLLIKNPFEFPLVTVIVNDSVRRDAITHDEKRRFLKFIKEDKHYSRYYDGFYILFYTGMRISEFVGLTIQDIDFEEDTVNIDHQLLRTSNMEYYIQTTKTESGKRVIPMSEEVKVCFQRIIENRKQPRVEPIVDGYSGFLYLDKNEMPMVALHWEKYFKFAVDKHNKIFKAELPRITPHVARHTYCSHMASAGLNPKHLQYLMGHSDIGVTLNVYTHIEWDKVKDEVNSIDQI